MRRVFYRKIPIIMLNSSDFAKAVKTKEKTFEDGTITLY
ncbi:hypothetical protein FH5_01693 [Priestia endophytica]|nr:hypothetical protein FH5_01693 [Priestia endophytica]